MACFVCECDNLLVTERRLANKLSLSRLYSSSLLSFSVLSRAGTQLFNLPSVAICCLMSCYKGLWISQISSSSA